MPEAAVKPLPEWGRWERWENMTRVARVWTFLSVVAVLGATFQIVLLVFAGGASTAAEMALLAVTMVVSAFPGVVIGFVLARQLALKCGIAGTYRRKVRSWLATIPLLLVVASQFWLRFVSLPILVSVPVGLFTAMSTCVLGVVWFERRAECQFWYGPMPTRQKPEWIEVRTVRLENAAAR
jgi:hypothetical protein